MDKKFLGRRLRVGLKNQSCHDTNSISLDVMQGRLPSSMKLDP